MNPNHRFFVILFYALFLGVVSETCTAQVYSEFNLSPIWTQSNTSVSGNGGSMSPPGVATESGFGFNLMHTLAYNFFQVMPVGLTLNYYNLPRTRPAVSGGSNSLDEKTTIFEYGLTLGYMNAGWHFLFTYLLSGTKNIVYKSADANGTSSVDLNTTNKLGKGFLFDFGYTWTLSSWLELGPSLVYRSVTYTSRSQINGLDSASNEADREYYTPAVEGSLQPFVTIAGKF